MGRFATTIFSATQRCNNGTMLYPFQTMLQGYRRCESSRVTLPLLCGYMVCGV